jgi:hypothetical protein
MSATAKVISDVSTVEGVRTCRVRLAPDRRVVQAIVLSPPGARIDIAKGDTVHISVAHGDLGAGVYVTGRFEAHGEADIVATQAQVAALQAQVDALVALLDGAKAGTTPVLYTPAGGAPGTATAAMLTTLQPPYAAASPATGKGRADDSDKLAKSFRVEIEGS